MLPRLKSWIVLAFMLLALYLVLWRDDTPFNSGEHPIDVLHGDSGEMKGADGAGLEVAPILDDIPLLLATTTESQSSPTPVQWQSTTVSSAAARVSTKASAVHVAPISSLRRRPSSTASTAQSASTKAAGNSIQEGSSKLQEQFQKENDALSL